jgi:hypothetical protein
MFRTAVVEDASGSIDLTVSGGTEPYTYSWSNGSTTADISGLVTGSYTVTVTDSKGCVKTLRVFVSRKTFLVPSQVVNPDCHGGNTGSITLLQPVGGEAPYTYLWSNGETGNSISELTGGTYSVVVTDNAGCSREVFFGITDPGTINATAEISNDQCNAEGFFNIDLSTSGGTAPYTWQWSDGFTGEDRELQETGTYTVTISDANGCSVEKEIIVNGDPSDLACLITAPGSMPPCGSENNILQTTITDADSYSWTVASSDPGWVITAGGNTDTIAYTAGKVNTSAAFSLTVIKDGCSRTCLYTVTTCTEDGTDGEDPDDGGEDPDDGEGPGEEEPGEDGSGNETCEECFNSGIVIIEEEGLCYTYEVVVNTTGNCKHDLSHWDIAIPCGNIRNLWNSEGWKMELGKDPTTGLSGLKVDGISGFGKKQDSFTVRFTVCYENGCTERPGHWNPVVAYKAGQCVGYDTLEINYFSTVNFELAAYPNPFGEKINFIWVPEEDDYGKLEIMDQFGHTIATPYQGELRKGLTYNIEWSSNEQRTGIYYYKLTTRSDTAYGKIFRN